MCAATGQKTNIHSNVYMFVCTERERERERERYIYMYILYTHVYIYIHTFVPISIGRTLPRTWHPIREVGGWGRVPFSRI